MAINKASWLDSYLKFFEKYLNLIKGKEPEVIDNAENNPGKPLVLSDEEKTEIQDQFDVAIDEAVDQTVSDINEEVGVKADSGVSGDTISYAKIVGGFFTIAAIERALNRSHGATVARQTEETRKEAQEKALEAGLRDLDVITASEIGLTSSRSAKEHQQSIGVTEFIWQHSGADHPRTNHLGFDGRTFSWDDPPDADGFPGEAYNCACVAIPKPNDTQNRKKTMSCPARKEYFNLVMNAGIADIWIKGEIGDFDFFTDEGVIFNDFKRLFEDAKQTSEKIVLHIDSPGGSAFDGVAIYNLIKQSEGDIAIQVEGVAASIASIIMLAVPMDKRFISTGAMVMIHDPWSCLCGNAAFMEQEIQGLTALSDSLAQIYAERTALSFDEAKDFMSQEKYFTADEAVQYGFASKLDAEAKPDTDAITDFLAKLKTCSVEQKGLNRSLLNYADVNLTGPKNMPTIEELKEQLTEANASKVKAKAKLSEIKEKLNAVETEVNQLKSDNEELQTSAGTHESEIQNLKTEALEKAKAQITEANELRNKAKGKGFKAEGETVTEIMAAVCVEAGMKNVEGFNPESLSGLFNFVLDRRENSKDVDNAFDPEDKNTETEIQFPAKRQRGAK